VHCVFAGKIMRLSADELMTFFQSDLMLDFGFDDNYVIQSLVITTQELHRIKLGLPAPPRPGDAAEKPTKPFGCFEPPSVERLIASMHIEATNGEIAVRPSIPADGGPVSVPEALLKRNASDWSFVDRDYDEVSSSHVSVAATDCPSSRTSLVSSLLDNVDSLMTTSESGVVSFVAADCAVSRTTLTDRTPEADQISNSEYDNVPPGGCDDFSSVYEQELEQTLESIQQEIEELLGGHADSGGRRETVSATVSHNDHLYSQNQQNHAVDSYASHTESPTKLDKVSTSSLFTSDVHRPVDQHATTPSPSTAVTGVMNSPPVMSLSHSTSYQPCQNSNDLVVIPIQHLPSAAPWRPPVKPKPKTPSASRSPPSALTPIPVLHLRTVPMAQFSSISAANRPVPTSSTNGC